jgi:hypothetical protein
MDTKWQSKILNNGIHVYVGGKGSPNVLLPGWPETAEAYLEVFSALSVDHQDLETRQLRLLDTT